ncbi:hypothetical protein SDC9_140474 [bioreactor metagenome]|uniref:Uncharacterized protein n=1 Tax=bioreactor metagenome TaxID=1076179 RepID=A0A645DVE0_9ZZZZ
MLVVLEENVVFRFEFFDEVGLKRKRLGLVGYTDILKIRNLPHHGGDLRRVIFGRLEILPYAVLQRNGFPNINNLARRVEHLVHAGRGREQFQFFFDNLVHILVYFSL